jgi:hypothetical protein
MKKKRNDVKKLKLSKETLGVLDPKSLEGLAGGAAGCGESNRICSIQHTCVSCQPTLLTADCA